MITKAKAELMELSRSLAPYVVGAEGNISSKLDDGNILIKASGLSMANPTPDHFILCDHNGKQLSNEDTGRPSIETPMHTWLYDHFDVKYIAHTHPINTLKILCSKEAEDFAVTRLFPDQVVFNGIASYVVEYANPGINLYDAMAKALISCVETPQLILMKNHGIVVLGKCITDCIIGTQICEKAAEIYIGSKSLGLVPMNQNEILQIKNDKNEAYRRNLSKNEKNNLC